MSEAKTEEPTPRRERNAREQGRAWQSRDLTLGAVLLVTGGLVRLGAAEARTSLEQLFTHAIEGVAAGGSITPRAELEASLLSGISIVVPWLFALVVVGALVSALQVGGLFAPRAIAPDPSRLDPTARSGSGTRIATTALLGLARFALLSAVAIATLVEGLPGIATLSRRPPSAALDACFTMSSALTLRAGLALVLFGVLDAIVERMQFLASLRMTRREREREQREAEGDAHVRRERARVREELHREGEVEEIRAATLLVLDGEELAVALAYDASDLDAVPRVVAVGHGARVDEMQREAREHGISRVDDGELAAQLAILSVGGAITETLYEPVARAMQSGRP